MFPKILQLWLAKLLSIKFSYKERKYYGSPWNRHKIIPKNVFFFNFLVPVEWNNVKLVPCEWGVVCRKNAIVDDSNCDGRIVDLNTEVWFSNDLIVPYVTIDVVLPTKLKTYVHEVY